MSLFPDEYPDEPEPVTERRTCCEEIVSFDQVGDFTWRLVHTFGHTRTAVGVASFASLAGCNQAEAKVALDAAEALGWLARIVPEPYQRNPPALWQGRLSLRS